jgi:hypothetical protein
MGYKTNPLPPPVVPSGTRFASHRHRCAAITKIDKC